MATPVEPYRALVAGATGAIGREIIAELVRSPRCVGITALTRREITPSDWSKEFPTLDVNLAKAKLTTQKIDWEQLTAKPIPPPSYFEGHQFAVMAMGTTRHDAGSAAAFERVDFTYVQSFAIACKAISGLRQYTQVSSQGADAKSCFLYLKTKGRADEMTVSQKFPSTSIFRPGFLARGDKTRMVEKLVSFFKKQIPVSTVARAIVRDFEINTTTESSGTCPAAATTTTATGCTPLRYFENSDILRLGSS